MFSIYFGPQQFRRGPLRNERHRAAIPGTKPGFWIASIVAQANDGATDVLSDGPGQRITASISLPAARICDNDSAGSAE